MLKYLEDFWRMDLLLQRGFPMRVNNHGLSAKNQGLERNALYGGPPNKNIPPD